LSIFYSLGSDPLQLWGVKQDNIENIKMVIDNHINSNVLQIAGENPSKNFIAFPLNKKRTLGIKLPLFVIILKNVV